LGGGFEFFEMLSKRLAAPIYFLTEIFSNQWNMFEPTEKSGIEPRKNPS
jgi:hypothetical protein